MVRSDGGRGQSPYTARVKLARRAGIVVTLGVAMAMAMIGVEEIHRWRAEASDARYWMVAGQPCPGLTREAFLAEAGAPDQVFAFGGVRFARVSGWASCEGQQSAFGPVERPVCQFTGPGVLAVTTRGGAFYFAPRWGRPATILAQQDTPRCVQNANFR
jgi:hypothetical protein